MIQYIRSTNFVFGVNTGLIFVSPFLEATLDRYEAEVARLLEIEALLAPLIAQEVAGLTRDALLRKVAAQQVLLGEAAVEVEAELALAGEGVAIARYSRI